MSAQYGTLMSEEAVVQKTTTSKVVVALAAVALMAVGVVALSSNASTHVNSVADANRNRQILAPVNPEVREIGLKVLNMTVNQMRWAIFGFNQKQNEIIPLMTGAATNDWEKDFIMFRNALPEDEACLGVYNFEYWVADTETELDPIMITWAPADLDPTKLANAGYFLGSEILALNTDEGRLNTESMTTAGNDEIGKDKGKGYGKAPERTGFSGPYRLESMSETYEQFCLNEMALGATMCSLDKSFHNCPFESNEDGGAWSESNPCKQEVCAGGAFANPDSAEADLGRTIPDACCDYINNDFCAAAKADGTVGEGVGKMGCHPVTLTAVAKLCESAEVPALTVVKGSYDDLKNCEESCRSSCALFDDPNDTYKECDGCAIDGIYDEATGQTSQCFPGAYGFQMDMCCGYNPDCVTFDSATMCGTQEYNQCLWTPQLECQALKDEQQLAAAPKGCCVIENAEDEGFGVSHERDATRNMLECGGEGDTGKFDTLPKGAVATFMAAGIGQEAQAKCDELQAAAQALADEAAAAAAAAAGATTAAPARRV